MDDLFTLIIIIVTVLSVVGKLKTKPAATKKSPPKGIAGWLTKLNTYLEEMQRQAIPPQEEAEEDIGADRWRRLMENETASIPPAGDMGEDLGDLEFVEDPEPSRAKPASDAARARVGLPPRQPPAQAEAPAEPLSVPEDRQILVPTSRDQLRQAIVWAEIIGPPVALKGPVSR